MDGDPKVESELDSFSLTFPLPYRIGFIIVLAVWGWGANLHYLHKVKIDVPTLIRYPTRSSPTEAAHHLSTYRLATVLSTVFFLSISTFWIFTRHTPSLVIEYDWLPMTYFVALAAIFFVPIRSFSHGGRSRFLATLKRVSIGGLAQAQDGKFGDILLADVLTSYSKILGDLYVVLCMFFTPSGSSTARPDRNCGGTVLVPLIMAVPFAIRFRQCIIEYLRVRNAPYKESVGWGGQHLANAGKYATAFPVIILSALQRSVPTDKPAPGLNRAWLVAVMVNSFYSWYWDVAKDWDLTLFSSARERNNPEHPFGLRRRLVFQQPIIYYGVIVMDLMLRCTWTVKLSANLDKFTDFESSIFLLQSLEVFRRWVWIFFRVETEWLRNNTSGLAVDDILLGDYQGKYDSDED
ncbi:putative EXS family protein [Colletotrichum karsti]|uniref:EXS family protein n=1 Tax=Colletotrichum karsti TaxID=1095194 RepID=A0A9P6LKC1_9PEZI|nr:putative EXS family protein [Colletotrichum karsti]KAF9879224.1 putative EXS family protein [Colletotrichum karsti]